MAGISNILLVSSVFLVHLVWKKEPQTKKRKEQLSNGAKTTQIFIENYFENYDE